MSRAAFSFSPFARVLTAITPAVATPAIKAQTGKICDSKFSLSVGRVTPPTDPDPGWTVITIIAVCERVPLVPVIVTV